jgi:hypothetical protein
VIVHSENLSIAIKLAIDVRSKIEQDANNDPNYKSALVAGWEATLEALKKGEQITIVTES